MLQGANNRFVVNLYHLVESKLDANVDSLIDESFLVAQQENESVSGAALAQMAVRFSAGDSSLAQAVRDQQDVTENWKHLNAELLSAFSKPPNERNTQKETELRDEIARLKTRLDEEESRLEKEFPEYATLANPKAISLAELKQLLRPDQALVSYLISSSTIYVWAVSKEGVEWHKLSISASDLEQMIQRLRQTLDIATVQKAIADGNGSAAMFDVGLAHDVEDAVLAPVEKTIRSKPRLLIVPAGPLTSLPFQVLVLKKPGKVLTRPSDYREIDWLVKAHAITTLPLVGSLKSLRIFAKNGAGHSPLVGYGDPIFQRCPGGRSD